MVNYSLNIATPLSVSPLVTPSGSAEKHVSIHPLTTGRSYRIASAKWVRLGPLVTDYITYRASHTIRHQPAELLK